MDSLGWDNPPAFMSTSCPWSNHQHEIGERYFVTNANYGILGGKLDLPESVFDPSPDLQRTTACNISSNSDRRSELIQQLAPVLDSMNGVYNLESSQCQEALAGTTWGEALMAELCSSPHVNRQYNINPSSGAVADVGTAEGLQVVNGVEDGEAGVSKAGSFESLDCLLSAANSNTDTSVEDDGISLILSDCRTLWNFGSSSAVSSGESENNGSNGNSKNVRRRVKEPDEAVSQSSLNSPKFNKRKKDQQECKVSANYHYFDLHHSNSSTTEGGFQLISENLPKSKKPRLEKPQRSSNINFQQPNSCLSSANEPDTEAVAHMKEMIYRAAAFRPVNLGLEVVEKTKRKNVRISSDPQTVAARHRRERISERIRVLQRLVPGGSKMDTATMLDEAANYLKFLRSQVQALETQGHKLDSMICTSTDLSFPSPPFIHPFPMQSFFPLPKP